MTQAERNIRVSQGRGRHGSGAGWALNAAKKGSSWSSPVCSESMEYNPSPVRTEEERYNEPANTQRDMVLVLLYHMCGAFGLGGNRQQDVEALRRCSQHLAPGGVLVFDDHVPYSNAKTWQYWLPEYRRQLPEPWPPHGQKNVGRMEPSMNCGCGWWISTPWNRW